MDTQPALGIVEILGIAASMSLLAGWRLYLVVLATGIAMRSGAVPLPEHLEALRVLANPWVMGVAGVAALSEFVADKVAWFDSLWDTVHTVIRPLGGALVTLAIVDPGDPAAQVVAFLLGGGGALLAIEGENDDISGIGQTRAALDLAPHLPAAKKKYHLARAVGHYGIFNGSKWRGRIAPVVEEWIAAHS